MQNRYKQPVKIYLVHSVLRNKFRYRSNSDADVKADELAYRSNESHRVFVVENAQGGSKIDADNNSYNYKCIHGQQSDIFEVPHVLLT